MAVTHQQLFSEANKKQAMADMLSGRAMQQRGPQQLGPVASKMHWGEGIAQLGEALLARRANKQADEKFNQADEAKRQAIAQAISGFDGSPQQMQGAIESGADPAVINAMIQARQPQAPVKLGQGEVLVDPNNRYSQLAAGPTKQQELPRGVQEYEYAKAQGYQGSYQDFVLEQKKAGAASTSVNLKSEGSIPAEHKAIRDEQGNIVRYERVPGGPGDIKQQQQEEADAAKQTGATQQADLISQEIDRALETMDSGILPDTGAGGWLANIPGTDAKKLKNLFTTIKANIGFNELQQMRNESPTGGALGNVSEREIDFLQALAGSLDQTQSKEELTFNLNRLWNAQQDIIHGPGNGERRELAPPSGDAPQPGAVVDGYVFLGGDPANESSWRKQ